MSFRNRCIIAGANGPVTLSLPLERGRDKQQFMKDVRINYSGRWQKEHLRTLESCYARSPYYEYYRDDVRRLWEEKHTFLLDKNMAVLAWLAGIFSYKSRISLTESYQAAYTADGVSDMRDRILPAHYRDCPAPVYTQVFGDRTGFQPNLSILDLLFCHGPSLNMV